MTDQEIADLIVELKDIRLQVTDVLERLEEANRRRSGIDAATRATETVNGISRGDRVRITNKVKRPGNWPSGKTWVEAQYRAATVTRVTTDQIYIETDNGVKTWRAPNNLKKI
jgi:hypothetical protein